MVCLKLMVGLQSARFEMVLWLHINVLQGERKREMRDRERERSTVKPLNKGQLRDASVLF